MLIMLTSYLAWFDRYSREMMFRVVVAASSVKRPANTSPLRKK